MALLLSGFFQIYHKDFRARKKYQSVGDYFFRKRFESKKFDKKGGRNGVLQKDIMSYELKRCVHMVPDGIF